MQTIAPAVNLHARILIAPMQANVLAQARGASEAGETARRNPALPEANGWAYLMGRLK
jgi:hypothetical protein